MKIETFKASTTVEAMSGFEEDMYFSYKSKLDKLLLFLQNSVLFRFTEQIKNIIVQLKMVLM